MSDLENLIANMTIADLARLSVKTASEIAAFALSGSTPATRTRASAPSTRPATNGVGKRAPRAGKASTRTMAGRGDLDQRVLEAIRAAGGPVRSVDIEGKVGGTPEQRRAALKRLVQSKKLKRAGVARATTYEAR